MTTALAPTALDLAQARVREAADAHTAINRRYWDHIRDAWREGSADFRCQIGVLCAVGMEIHHDATAAAHRLDFARQDEHRAMRARFSVVDADRAWSRVAAEDGR